jgi:hypothetical protein
MIGFISKFKQNYKLRKQNALDLIPKALVKHSVDEIGRVTLHVKRFKIKSLNRLFNKADHFNVKLDATGSKVWLSIDGIRNIDQITISIAGEDLSFDETASRVTTFITDLYKKDLVGFD